MLSAADQERFSRHLLLDGLGGKGQERICAGSVEIALPAAFALVAKACARSLAAAGVGRLVLRGSWADSVSQECAALSSSTEIVAGEARAQVTVSVAHEGGAANPDQVFLAAEAPRAPAEAAALGAFAALEAMKRLAQAGSPAALPLAVFTF